MKKDETSLEKNETRYLVRRVVESVIYLLTLVGSCVATVLFIVGTYLWLEYGSNGGGETRWYILFIRLHPLIVAIGSVVVCVASLSIQAGMTTGESSYRFKTLMPTFKINKCNYCKKELSKDLNLICSKCKKLFPLGLYIAMIRMAGMVLTWFNWSLILLIIAIFIVAFIK